MQRININIRLIRHLVLRYSLVWIADTVSIAITALLLPGIYFLRDSAYWFLHPFIVALGFGLLNALVRPFLILLLLPITFVTLGLATLLLNAGLFYLLHLIVTSFVIDNFLAAVVGVLFLTLVNTFLGNLVKLGDDYSFYATMMSAFSTMTRPKEVDATGSGLVLLQIDGLSHAALKRALRGGRMPFLTDMLKRRKYVMRKWFSGLPSQTSAVQTAIFYGSSYNIPGFRWYDKAARRVVVSSNATDMSAVDDRLGKNGDSLLKNGTCINSLVHGGAHKRILTVSAMHDKDLKHHKGSLEDFAIFSLHPYLYARTILMMVWDFIVDRFETFVDLVRRKQPRLPRSIKFSFLRAVANAAFRETSTYFVMEDIIRGIPIIYANYIGYDMVAHYGGPTSRDSLSTLAGIDRQIRKIYRMISRRTDKPFGLIVLSDHGQSQSVPFDHLYGRDLPTLIAETIKKRALEPSGDRAELGYLHTLIREMRMVEEAYGTMPIRRGRRTLERLREKINENVGIESDGEEVVVCPSGNLAHVYFAETPARVTTEWVVETHPGLLESLVSHPGIGFVITTNSHGEHLVMGRNGMRRMVSGEIEGTDPLASYAPGATLHLIAEALLRLCRYPNAGDIILNGALIAEGTVVTFEPQRGTHGGLGGAQTEPFIIYPQRFRRHGDNVKNPVEMHEFLSQLIAS